MTSLFYTTYICVDLAHDEIFRAKVGKGGIRFIKHAYSGSVSLNLSTRIN